MLRFILRRLIVTLPMVLVVVSLTWGLIRLAPGNFYTGEKAIPPAIEENLRLIDRALAEIHLAMERHPESHTLGLLLAETYRREADLLEQIRWWSRPPAAFEPGLHLEPGTGTRKEAES